LGARRFDIGIHDRDQPAHIAFFEVVDNPGDDPNGYRLEFASTEEREHRVFAAEGAMARTQMEEWNAWKASR